MSKRRGDTTREPRDKRRPARPPGRGRLHARAVLFVAVAGITVALAAALLWPSQSAGPADRTVEVTMGGFSTPLITTAAGRPLRLEIVNPDSSMHTDGGGWHQLAIPNLGVDARVGPKSRSLVDIPAAAPGEYAFYCDVCCGGKENPSMQGVLKVV